MFALTPACCLATLLAAVASPAVPARPSIAILAVDAKTGVAPATAELVTDTVVAALQESRVFSRLIGQRELQASVGLEQQRQLLNCIEQGCLAEIAGALDVDFILVGNVGRLGDTFVVNLKLVRARSGELAATVAESSPGTSESVLLDTARAAVRRLVDTAGLLPGASSSGETSRPAARLPLRVLGVVALVTSLPAPLVTLGALGFFGVFLQGMFGVLFPIVGIPLVAKVAILGGTAGVAALGTLAGLVLLLAGAALLGTGIVL